MKRLRLIFLIFLVLGCARVFKEKKLPKELERDIPLCAILTTGEEKYVALGEDMKDGVLLGLGDVDSKIYYTAGDPISAIEKAKLAIFGDGVTCVIGPLLSSTAIPVACISELSGVPMISPTATEMRLPLIGEYIYRLYSPHDVEEIALARYILNTLRPYYVAVLAPDDSYGRDITRRFKEEMERHGSKVNPVFYYTPGSTNLRDKMLSLRDLDVDAIFIPANESDITTIASQFAYYEVIDSSTVILGLKEWGYPEIIEEYKNYLPYVIFTSLLDFKEHPEFEKEFIKKFHRAPTETAVMGYSAGRLYSLALKDGANRRNLLKDWLLNNQLYQPLEGICLSSEEVVQYVRIFEVYRGELRQLK